MYIWMNLISIDTFSTDHIIFGVWFYDLHMSWILQSYHQRIHLYFLMHYIMKKM